MSVDALRGFDMFWIIGADALVYALQRIADGLHGKAAEGGSLLYRFVQMLADQLEHAEWAGFHFYDMIFPLFVFIVGVSTVFSLTKNLEQGGKAAAVKRVLRRGILLFAVALFYSGGFTNNWPNIRLVGVLNRIALAYTATGLLFIFLKPRALVAVCVSLLVGYWALMSFSPIRDIQLTRSSIAAIAEDAGDKKVAKYYRNEDSPNPSTVKDSEEWAAAEKYFQTTTNFVAGKDAVRTNVVVTKGADGKETTSYVVEHFAKGLNLCDHTDFQHLAGKKYDTFFDPEGYLSTIPAVATCLLGVFAGMLLGCQQTPDSRKLTMLLVGGLIFVILGRAWSADWAFQFPVIKKIWTSSFVLLAGGYSMILLGMFYLVVDVMKFQKWCQPFVWMGMNSITVYLASNMLGGFRKLSARLVGGDVRDYLDAHIAKGFGDLAIAIVGLLLAFLLVRFLYKRKVFLRL